MPILPRLRSREPLDAAAAEGLLNGRGAVSGAPAGQQALARVLAIASGPASDSELAGQAAAMAAFAATTSLAGPARPDVRKRRLRVSLLAAKLALAAAACVAASGGAAAYATALPAPLQELAHITFGAPAPRHTVRQPPGTDPSPGHLGRPGHPAARAHGQPSRPKGRLNGGNSRKAAGHQKSHPSGKGHPKSHPASHNTSPASHNTSPASHRTHPPSAAGRLRVRRLRA